ncbi:MAG: preprotein translocase subunit SecG [Burkholderiaceae bacterium]
MAWFGNVLQLLQVVAALGVVILVLLQHGKGADMGAAFGSGSSGSLFGASGSANFLSRATAGFAVVFFVTTLGLAFMANKRPEAPSSVMSGAAPATAPAGTAGSAAGTSTPADANSQIPGTNAPESGGRSDIPK